MEETKKKVALSGIQPTGIFTLGNYLGAVRNWEKLQKNYECIFFIANLHSLTTKRDAKTLKDLTSKIVALLIACGIDTNKHTLFIQSDISYHAELSWVLQCLTQFGELKRMTQFKDKSQKNSSNINAGLFCYPVLMAADILLYNPDVIPIGIDQKQHLELTETIATRFNNTYGKTFKIPKGYIPEIGAKIMSLTDPTKKMSKSDENQNSFISILDTEEIILNKFKKATTDSDNKIIYSEEKPGVSNLLSIFSSFSEFSIEDAQEHFKNKTYKDLKFETADIVTKNLKPVQEKYNELLKDKDKLKKICEEGAEKARVIAKKTLDDVYEKVGLK